MTNRKSMWIKTFKFTLNLPGTFNLFYINKSFGIALCQFWIGHDFTRMVKFQDHWFDSNVIQEKVNNIIYKVQGVLR